MAFFDQIAIDRPTSEGDTYQDAQENVAHFRAPHRCGDTLRYRKHLCQVQPEERERGGRQRSRVKYNTENAHLQYRHEQINHMISHRDDGGMRDTEHNRRGQAYEYSNGQGPERDMSAPEYEKNKSRFSRRGVRGSFYGSIRQPRQSRIDEHAYKETMERKDELDIPVEMNQIRRLRDEDDMGDVKGYEMERRLGGWKHRVEIDDETRSISRLEGRKLYEKRARNDDEDTYKQTENQYQESFQIYLGMLEQGDIQDAEEYLSGLKMNRLLGLVSYARGRSEFQQTDQHMRAKEDIDGADGCSARMERRLRQQRRDGLMYPNKRRSARMYEGRQSDKLCERKDRDEMEVADTSREPDGRAYGDLKHELSTEFDEEDTRNVDSGTDIRYQQYLSEYLDVLEHGGSSYGKKMLLRMKLDDLFGLISCANSLGMSARVSECLCVLQVQMRNVCGYARRYRVQYDTLASNHDELKKKYNLMLKEKTDVSQKVQAEEGQDCVVCMVVLADHAYTQCGHRVLCANCVRFNLESCPMCSATGGQWLKIYG